jgi:hypothetical protein
MPKVELQNIASYYREAYDFLFQRKRRQVNQLILLNNLNRGDQNIASTLLITLFTRMMSSHYRDRLQVKFLPSQEINQEQINAFNTLAESDYLEMDKAKVDYDWMWDSMFFGRGYCETLRFNTKRKIMEPQVINPLMFGYDPYFNEVQDWRYYWKWITKSRWELERLIKAKVITGIKEPDEIPSGIDTTLWDYKIKVDQARKGVAPSSDTQNGDVFQILEVFCYDEDGDKCVSWVDKGMSKILFTEKLDLEDGEEFVAPDGQTVQGASRWPLVTKEAFRDPHSSIQFSVADLLDDKHRAKSVLLNLAFIAAKDRANPIYGYNPEKVQDVTQFFSRQINQHIPMDSQDAAWPLFTEDPMSAGLMNFISVLTDEANAPVGTGTTLNPDKGSKETATEIAIEQQLNDMAQSLQTKVMQFGEAEFWSHWFYRYKKYGPEFESKLANITGVKGIETEEIDMKHFDCRYPPGVQVYSSQEAQFKETTMRRDLIAIYPQLAQTLGPDGIRNFNKHVFFPKFLEDPSLIDLMLPDTIDEQQAEKENEILAKDKYAKVLPTDDHTTHLYTHQKMFPKTLASIFHMAEHRDFLAKQKQAEAQAIEAEQQQIQQQTQQTQGPANKQVRERTSKDRRNPQSNATPLKQEVQTNNNQIV